jgi:hypothetical protein
MNADEFPNQVLLWICKMVVIEGNFDSLAHFMASPAIRRPILLQSGKYESQNSIASAGDFMICRNQDDVRISDRFFAQKHDLYLNISISKLAARKWRNQPRFVIRSNKSCIS